MDAVTATGSAVRTSAGLHRRAIQRPAHPEQDERRAITSRRVLLYWSVGVLSYFVAVLYRQSLGVAGLEAAARLGAGPSGLATLAMLQLLVYIALQIPVGVLVDRLGSKRMLITGVAVMVCGQSVFALAADLVGGITGRMLVGAGDAMSFISVIRLVNLWFPAHRIALFVQLTGLLGQLGAVVSTVPLIYLLGTYGWTATFLATAGIGVAALIIIAGTLRDHRRERAVQREPALRAAWAQPGTRLGMWTHAASQCSVTAFLLLWGFPFLVEDQGLIPATAGVLLTALTLTGMISSPLVGYLSGRFPLRRSWMVLGVISTTATAWTVVLLWPGQAPLWLLAVLALVLALNGPGALIGFDFARTFNPAERIGTATGIVNSGGYVASMSVIVLVGLTLDLTGDYSWAFAVQYPVWLFGAVQVLRYNVRAGRPPARLGADLGKAGGGDRPDQVTRDGSRRTGRGRHRYERKRRTVARGRHRRPSATYVLPSDRPVASGGA